MDSIRSQPPLDGVLVTYRPGLVLELEPGLKLRFEAGELRLPMNGTVRTAQGREVDVADLWPQIHRHPLNGDRESGFVDQTVHARHAAGR